jgi:hypothetical protein
MDIGLPRAETLDDKPGVELQFIVCASDGDVENLDGGCWTTTSNRKNERHEAKAIWMLYGVNVIGFHAIESIKSRQELLLHQPASQRSTWSSWSHRTTPAPFVDTHMAHRGTNGLVILKVMPRLFSIDEEVRGTGCNLSCLRELSQWIVTKMLPKKWLRHPSKSVNVHQYIYIFTINYTWLSVNGSEWGTPRVFVHNVQVARIVLASDADCTRPFPLIGECLTSSTCCILF